MAPGSQKPSLHGPAPKASLHLIMCKAQVGGRISSEKWISTMRRSGQGNRLRQHTNGSIGSVLYYIGFVVQDVFTGWMKSEEIK